MLLPFVCGGQDEDMQGEPNWNEYVGNWRRWPCPAVFVPIENYSACIFGFLFFDIVAYLLKHEENIYLVVYL